MNEIVSRQEPHVSENQLSIAVKIRDQAMTPQIPSNADPVLVEVIHKCLKANPSDRPVSYPTFEYFRYRISEISSDDGGACQSYKVKQLKDFLQYVYVQAKRLGML